MNLEDFVTSKLKETEFYDEGNNMFYPWISDEYTEIHIEEMVSTFVGQYAFQRHKQSDYKVFTEHVFDSPGLDIYITFVSYAEYDEEKVNIEAFIIDSYCC